MQDITDRLGENDSTKITIFTTCLKNLFESYSGIKIGTYLVGRVTYPEEIYKECEKRRGALNDIDLIVAAYDRNYLKPSKTNSVRCPLTKKLKKFFKEGYMDEFLMMDTSEFKFSFEEIKSRNGEPSEYRKRPNILLATPLGLPIHLVAQYKDPKTYNIGTSRKEQLTFQDAVEKEIRHANPFYVL